MVASRTLQGTHGDGCADVKTRFESMVALHGGRAAVWESGLVLSYAELNRKANRIAHAVSSMTASMDTPVCVYLEQGVDALAAVLGCLKSGRCYIPLDPSFPPERSEAIFRASGAALVIANAATIARFPAGVAAAQCAVLRVEEADATCADHNPELVLPPELPAYVIYTSGSSGTPKGVLQYQRNLLINSLNQAEAFHLTHEDRLPLPYSPSVMGAVRVQFNALLSGAAVYCVDVKRDGFGALRECLIEQRLTVYHSVATLFRHFCATLSGESFPDLRYVILGGEAATSGDFALFERHFPAAQGFFTGYGSTETGSVCVRMIGRASAPPPGNLAPGHALPGVRIRILDEQLRELAAGEEGEIAITSPALAAGYWRDPELSGQVFVRLDGEDQPLSYLTRDLGRLDANGMLTHTGRKDFQLKVRGFKVDPAEVEAVLMQVSGLREACVIGRKNNAGDLALTAFYAADRELAAGELAAAVGVRLPAHMVPSHFVRIAALPLTATGKVDRLALRELPLAEREPLPAQTPVSGKTALALRAIWEELLGVAVNDGGANFFELGGDSLLAARMAEAISRRLSREVPIGQIFSAPTVAGLARAIDTSLSMSPVITLRPGGLRTPLFFVHSPRQAMNLTHYFRERDRAVHVLSIFGIAALRSGSMEHADIAKLAQSLVTVMRQTQRQGPFQLASFCGDSLLALEIARQLSGQGEEVARVVLIDGLLQPHKPSLRGRLRALLGTSLRENLGIVRDKLQRRRSRRRLEDRDSGLGGAPALPATPDGGGIERVRELDRSLYRAYQARKRTHQPTPYPGQGVVLLLTSEWFDADQRRLRDCVLGDIQVEEVSGYHSYIVEKPYAARLAARIEHHLL